MSASTCVTFFFPYPTGVLYIVKCTMYVQYSVHGNASFCCILNTHASSFHMLSCWALSIFCTKFFSISVSDVYVHGTVCIDFITFLQFQYPMSIYMVQYVLISLLFYNFSIRCQCTVMHWFHYFIFYIKNLNFSIPCPCFVGVDLITLMCALCVLCLQLCAIHYACAYVTLLCTFK